MEIDFFKLSAYSVNGEVILISSPPGYITVVLGYGAKKLAYADAYADLL